VSEFVREVLESPVGANLGEEVCHDLLAVGVEHSYPKGTLIFQEGDEATGMYLVVRGCVKLTRYTAGGREVILHLAEAVFLIAEAAIFLGTFPATAVTQEETTVLFIHRDHVFALMERHPAFLRRVFESMARWMTRLVDKIDQLTLNDATARLARYLLEQHREKGGAAGEDPRKLRLPMKKGELAAMLNMNQATLSRTLRRLQDDKILAVSGRNVTLLNPEALRRLSLPPLG